MREIEVRMKCAACGYTGSSEEDFISELFLSTTVYDNEDHRLTGIEHIPVRIFVCPMCRALKIMTPEDKRHGHAVEV
jgi:rubredoxin